MYYLVLLEKSTKNFLNINIDNEDFSVWFLVNYHVISKEIYEELSDFKCKLHHVFPNSYVDMNYFLKDLSKKPITPKEILDCLVRDLNATIVNPKRYVEIINYYWSKINGLEGYKEFSPKSEDLNHLDNEGLANKEIIDFFDNMIGAPVYGSYTNSLIYRENDPDNIRISTLVKLPS